MLSTARVTIHSQGNCFIKGLDMAWINWAIETVLLFALCGSARILYLRTRSIQELRVRFNELMVRIQELMVRFNNLQAELAEFLDEEDPEEEMPTIDSGYCEF